MRVISLYQPYATLCVLGLKKNETRGWDTKYRGPLAIHATAGMPGWCKELCRDPALPFLSALAAHGYTVETLPKGAIVGTVELVSTTGTTDWLKNYVDTNLETPPDEVWYGDYSEGRFAWQLEKAIQFDPIPAKGRQGFWNYDFFPFLSGNI